jgi:hypothetical protein
METVWSWTGWDLEELAGIIAEGERRFKERQMRSRALIGGTISSWQIARAPGR